MRGSAHDHDIREYAIDGTGMHIMGPFRDVSGVLSGSPIFLAGEVPETPGERGEREREG
jgi:circadian clock protein KaiC